MKYWVINAVTKGDYNALSVWGSRLQIKKPTYGSCKTSKNKQ